MHEVIVRLHQRDERVLFYVVERRQGWLDRAARSLTHLGDAAVTIAISAGLLLSPASGWHAAGERTAFALVVSHLFVQLLKRSVSRTRPRLPEGILSLVEAPDQFSFPSGHSAAALSVALGIATILPGAAPWLLTLGLLVGVTRCYLGVHYPGDVVAGWVLAAAAFVAGASI